MSIESQKEQRKAFSAGESTRRNLRADRVACLVLGLGTGLLVLPLAALLAYLLWRSWPALTWRFIVEVPRCGMRAGGIWPALVGTAYMVVFSLLVSGPVGILAGIYLNEFAKDNGLTRLISLAVVNLAGIPSIVYALFGVGAFVIFLGLGKSILSASFTLAIMTLPVIIVSTKEALAAVPMSFRVACWNLGATRWQVIWTIVLPNSIGGILTGLILQVSRAAGETALVMFTGAVFYKAVEPGRIFMYSVREQCMALSYHLYALSTQVVGVPEPMLYATAVVLVGFVMVFNSAAIVIRLRMRARKKW